MELYKENSTWTMSISHFSILYLIFYFRLLWVPFTGRLVLYSFVLCLSASSLLFYMNCDMILFFGRLVFLELLSRYMFLLPLVVRMLWVQPPWSQTKMLIIFWCHMFCRPGFKFWCTIEQLCFEDHLGAVIDTLTACLRFSPFICSWKLYHCYLHSS